MEEIIKKLKKSKFPQLTFVGKNYTKEDLIKDLEVIKEENKQLREACQSMLETTGGSKHWNGETHKSLLLIEAALQ